MILKQQVTDIFCVIDEFTIEFEAYLTQHTIGKTPKKKPKLSTSEVMTIMVLFQLSGVRCFKWIYNQYLKKTFKG